MPINLSTCMNIFRGVALLKLIFRVLKQSLCNWESEIFLLLCLVHEKGSVGVTDPVSGRFVFNGHRLRSVFQKSLKFITALRVLKCFICSSKYVRLPPYPLLVAMECVRVHSELENYILIFVTKLKRGSDVHVDKRLHIKLNLRCSLWHGSRYSRKITINSDILKFNQQSSETNRWRRH